MPRLTITVTDEQNELLAELSGDGGPYESKSEAVREFIDSGETTEDLRREVERLNRERRQLLEQREENQELVRFADEQRSVVRAQREEERRRRQTNIVRRTWWKVAGEPDFDVATQD